MSCLNISSSSACQMACRASSNALRLLLAGSVTTKLNYGHSATRADLLPALQLPTEDSMLQAFRTSART
jgi:hypothetical protein